MELRAFLCWIPLASLAAASVTLDWSVYPAASRQCLDYYTRSSGCDDTSVFTLNSCLCVNGANWVVNIAQCITKIDPEDMRVVYGTLKAACAATGTQITFSVDDFIFYGGGATTTSATTDFTTDSTTLYTSTTTTTSETITPTTTAVTQGSTSTGGSGGGLSVSDKIAIGIGVPVGAFTIIGVLISCLKS
jgi:hypothetical protein